ncbi:carboxymuconolactone decarboxylase family protein [Thermocatellispora tengchongensis]|uniref:carboxymuconolactone decarboxylase family protein n=1 Tax=Thermocatellispora tengchongensis TaxID=1073253 RepID=UPI001C8493C5
MKELIYCAFDASATHLYAPGLKLHMRNAVRYGATAEEIMEVLEIVSVIGIHAATTAAPMLEAAVAESAAMRPSAAAGSSARRRGLGRARERRAACQGPPDRWPRTPRCRRASAWRCSRTRRTSRRAGVEAAGRPASSRGSRQASARRRPA